MKIVRGEWDEDGGGELDEDGGGEWDEDSWRRMG